MFDYETGYYEYNYRTLRSARSEKASRQGRKNNNFSKHKRKHGNCNNL